MVDKKFSERLGIPSTPKTLQIEGMSEELKNSLWNTILDLFEGTGATSPSFWKTVARVVARDFIKYPIDELSYHEYENKKWLKNQFYGLPWYRAYELIEFIIEDVCTEACYYCGKDKGKIREKFNLILKRELSGYQFIYGILSPISNEAEIAEIETAISKSQGSNLSGVYEHLRTALKLFGKKPEPDYRNAIKEVISGVESLVKQISGVKSGGA